MSGASNFLDPVEAVQDEISRSKRVIASALDDLSQHHSWLESYHRDERRRAQRLKRQETLQALELKRQRAAWRARRFAVGSYVVTRKTAAFLARNGSAFLAWSSPRAKAATLLLARESSAALSWSWRTGGVLARKGYGGASTGFLWSVHTSDILGVAFRARLAAASAWLYTEAAIRAEPILRPVRRRASAGWTRTRLRSKRLASTAQARLTDAWSRTRSETPILIRRSGEGIVDGFTWTVRTTDAVGIEFRKRALAGAEQLYAEATIRAQPALDTASERWARASFASKQFASTLHARTADGWTRVRSGAPTVAQSAAATTSRACTWLAEQAPIITAQGRDRLAVALERSRQHARDAAHAGFASASTTWDQSAFRIRSLLERRGPNHRALIVRRCTALVCIEPRRARLPVIRAS